MQISLFCCYVTEAVGKDKEFKCCKWLFLGQMWLLPPQVQCKTTNCCWLRLVGPPEPHLRQCRSQEVGPWFTSVSLAPASWMVSISLDIKYVGVKNKKLQTFQFWSSSHKIFIDQTLIFRKTVWWWIKCKTIEIVIHSSRKTLNTWFHFRWKTFDLFVFRDWVCLRNRNQVAVW